MTITKPDVLFYWDHETKSIAPTIGGKQVFSRAGNAFVRQPDGRMSEVLSDTPRFEPDGLLIERTVTNLLSDPFDPDQGDANWAGVNGTMTRVGQNSIYDNQSASAYVNDDAGTDRHIIQDVGNFSTTTYETISMIIETGNAPDCGIGLWDLTAGNWQALGTFNFASGEFSSLSGTGTNIRAGAKKITDAGPNGGVVWQVYVTELPSSVNSRRCAFFPSGFVQSGNYSTLHACQCAQTPYNSSLVDGSRPYDAVVWLNNIIPQQLTTYFRFITNNEGANSADYSLYPAIWGWRDVSAGANRYELSWATDEQLQAYMVSSSGTTGGFNLTLPNTAGDLIEIVTTFNTDGTGRAIGRVNGGSLVAADNTAFSSGTYSNFGSYIEIGHRTDGSHGSHNSQILKIVKTSSLEGSTDAEVMAEMAGLFVSPDGQRVSNTI